MSAILHEARAASLGEALRDPACYPHPVDRVEVLETHISWVFLAGEFAYKVKKPVRLPFLDFSSLSERYYYCREEVRLNRRTAPQVYLDVVPIGGEPPRIGESSPLADYAVRMRRFPQQALLERLAEEGRLEPGHVDLLADEVARFHCAVAIASDRDDYGLPDRVCVPALRNFEDIAQLQPPPGMGPALEALRDWTRLECHDLERNFVQRKAGGFVRECHGDLHLANVVMVDGRPLLFDCVEFSAVMRWTDVMNDVAFLLMDLVHHGQPRLAWRFLDRYLETTGDYGGLAVLRFYAVYRAMVRAKIACIRARQVSDPHERAGCEHAFERYVALAERLSRREPPLLVLMHGFAASGKTTASQRLLEAMGAVRLRSDVERKRLHGLCATERAAAAPGEAMYGTGPTERTYARLAAITREALEAGYPAIIDATFLDRGQREHFRDIAREARAGFEIVSCEVAPDVLRERIERRLRKGDDASDASLAVLERQLVSHDPLGAEERVHCTRLDTTCASQWRGAVESLARRLRMPMESG